MSEPTAVDRVLLWETIQCARARRVFDVARMNNASDEDKLIAVISAFADEVRALEEQNRRLVEVGMFPRFSIDLPSPARS